MVIVGNRIIVSCLHTKMPKPISEATSKPRRRISRRRKLLFISVSLVFGLFVASLITEISFRIVEARQQAQLVREGTGFGWENHERWGWAMARGKYRRATHEFDMRGLVNDLWMNDGIDYDAEADQDCVRILALGDSHTAAVGVSSHETWVAVLQRLLNQKHGANTFRCYNSGAAGYSLHQYLLRLIDQGPIVKPDYVIVGFSFATDLYDLLPPERGGWVYGENRPRAYFDINAAGALVEKYWDSSIDSQAPAKQTVPVSRRIKRVLGNFATFRQLRRSTLALAIGSRLKLGSESLWPNMEIVLEKEISPKHQYQWDLNGKLLERIHVETKKLNAELIVLGIPYLPQVYDDVWKSTFGGNESYSRNAAAVRIAAWCQQRGIHYVETLDSLRIESRSRGHWLHHRADAHPNTEGHEVIASTLLDTNLLQRKPY